jgi:cation diffusion facilitator family transporter
MADNHSANERHDGESGDGGEQAEHGHHHDQYADHAGEPRDHDHAPHTGVIGIIRSLLVPHSHDGSDSIDNALTSSREGMTALKVSLIVLAVTAAVQAVIAAASGSVGLLADTIHNAADALTAIPLGIAFWLGRRRPTTRYTYGYGRAEDLAGVFIVAVILLSAVVAAWEAITRLIHPHHVGRIGWVIAAGVLGFVGNEIAARYRISTGRKIGSAALVADGLHARTDGFTSLAVVIGALGVLAGWKPADAIIGLLISVAILRVLVTAARDIYRRLMDSVDPDLVHRVEDITSAVDGVQDITSVRIRWVGHDLHAAIRVTVDPRLSIEAAHDVSEAVNHDLLHRIPRLKEAIIHCDPRAHGDGDPHARTAHHDHW